MIFHLTMASDWKQSEANGEHRVSGRGMTLESQGYIHLCYPDQLSGVVSRYWGDLTDPVCLLTVDPLLLPVPVVAENTTGGTELFPHLYGPLPISAVVAVRLLVPGPDGTLDL